LLFFEKIIRIPFIIESYLLLETLYEGPGRRTVARLTHSYRLRGTGARASGKTTSNFMSLVHLGIPTQAIRTVDTFTSVVLGHRDSSLAFSPFNVG
jgi:hypothetical protein